MVEVVGRNWIVALGRAVEVLGHTDALARLACEVLPNGTVIARDASTGLGYVVQLAEAEGTPAPEVDPEVDGMFELPADAIRELPPAEDVGFRILRAPTVLQACQLALTTARAAVDAESGAILLVNRGQLWFAAAHGPVAARLTGVRMPLGTGVAGFAMDRMRSILLADAHADPRHWGEVDALTGHRTREMAVIPLMDETGPIGVLEVLDSTGGRGFAERDLDVLHPIADALALRLAR